jgi:tetratricopeptide (TPR) repeat protein
VNKRQPFTKICVVVAFLAASLTSACTQRSAFDDPPAQQPAQPEKTPAALLQDAYEMLMQGYTQAQAGNMQAAIKAYNQAITLSPTYLHAWLFRGKAFATLGDHDSALADYARALQLQPGHADVLMQRAVLYHNAMQYDLAIVDYDDALVADPGNIGTLMKRGLAHLMLDSFGPALADFDRILSQEPGNATIAANATARRGDCFRKMGDSTRAATAYEAALALDPHNGVALNGQLILLGDDIGR